MHGIVEKMNLKTCELPNFTTVCVRKQQLKVAVWRTLLRLSVDLHDAGDAQAIDATGFDRYSASRHYANRTDWCSRGISTDYRRLPQTRGMTGTISVKNFGRQIFGQ